MPIGQHLIILNGSKYFANPVDPIFSKLAISTVVKGEDKYPILKKDFFVITFKVRLEYKPNHKII